MTRVGERERVATGVQQPKDRGRVEAALLPAQGLVDLRQRLARIEPPRRSIAHELTGQEHRFESGQAVAADVADR